MKKINLVLALILGLALSSGNGAALAAAPQTAVKKIPVKTHIRSQKASRHKSASLENAHRLLVHSASALVQDAASGEVLYQKNAATPLPIASITKLMTAMVALDAKPDMDETLTITPQDVDTLKGSRSRLSVGAQLTRDEIFNLALMSSENRAAYALSANYPGGREAFVSAMNKKARELGLADTRFADPTGLTAENVSTAHDLARLVGAAYDYPLIRKYTTTVQREVSIRGRAQLFRNTNSLVKNSAWDINLSKTGYISEAGKCLVMHALVNDKPTIIVLLDSQGKLTRVGDANRIKRWIESAALAQKAAAG